MCFTWHVPVWIITEAMIYPTYVEDIVKQPQTLRLRSTHVRFKYMATQSSYQCRTNNIALIRGVS